MKQVNEILEYIEKKQNEYKKSIHDYHYEKVDHPDGGTYSVCVRDGDKYYNYLRVLRELKKFIIE